VFELSDVWADYKRHVRDVGVFFEEQLGCLKRPSQRRNEHIVKRNFT
jgi:hypothetical protein